MHRALRLCYGDAVLHAAKMTDIIVDFMFAELMGVRWRKHVWQHLTALGL